jgi:hypothetical protein
MTLTADQDVGICIRARHPVLTLARICIHLNRLSVSVRTITLEPAGITLHVTGSELGLDRLVARLDRLVDVHRLTVTDYSAIE